MQSKLRFLYIFLLFPTVYYAQRTETIIQDYLFTNKNLGNAISFKIESEEYSPSMKSTVVKLQQTIDDIPVHNAVASVLIRKKKIQYFSNQFNFKIENSRNSAPKLSAKDVFSILILNFNKNKTNYQILNWEQPESGIQNFAKQRPVYFIKDEKPNLAYEFIFPENNSPNFWNVFADASTGEIFHKQNLNLACFHQNTIHDITFKHTKTQEFSFINDEKIAPNLASYHVFALPIESPNFGSRSLVTNPYVLSASPEGWHSDGSNSFTITRGNNVYAYDDLGGNNQIGSSPDGGNSRDFNFPLNLNQPAINNKSAAITNLFYVNNKSHDNFYQFGFTESSRNFQANNFGKGGKSGDAVFAEAQDGGDFNNANFATPPDGTSPRMQMYLWQPASIQRLFYNAPTLAIPRTPNSRNADFGQDLTAAGITANIEVANIVNACNALPANSMSQKIGLAERGDCSFVIKVKNIQNAGGVGAIIYNAANSVNFNTMGGTDASITIPSILIENTEGEFIKTTIANGTTVNVSLKHDSNNDVFIDGSFDNGIIIHEYTHGVSNRSTGNGYSCLDRNISKEQMGEGWSDFFSLMMTNTQDATAAKPRSISTFAAGQDAAGNGIRIGKYSPDFAVDGFTYASTNGREFLEDGELKPDVHAIGFVWASILWDMHWKFANKFGFSSDIVANPNSGSAKVTQLVMDGLKIQECNPTFISGRDAIIAADIASNNGENRCMIWETFAKRGVGVDASAGAKNNINDQTEDYKIPEECISGNTNSDFFIYPNPANVEFSINFPISTFGKVVVQIYDLSGRLISTTEKLVVNSRQKFSTQNLSNGNYFVKINSIGGEKTLKLIVGK
ncbi:T9SS-dependent M36 family metallopeptidase [Frigoriflavimonas asaccharolytica]|uniref:Uncharacterized protein n=1 Tax=Frigoriflavimonas asaccharolytica TaxID=2735899 RepID=A0A8J8KAG4_9FLAO|nr:T9SS-dependent M36 family metallopeptidase [Frigoriflavimonas asaccharolytica]NRS91459.1 hypothetical protein [Frigoriflavimonas asaccharolytica]